MIMNFQINAIFLLEHADLTYNKSFVIFYDEL